MRSTSIGVAYLEMRECWGSCEPDVHQLFAEAVHGGRELKDGADNEPVEWCAGHGWRTRAGLVVLRSCSRSGMRMRSRGRTRSSRPLTACSGFVRFSAD
jgi:hypothetical protein